ncbi:ribonuclease H [Trifolium pratense]|uniref:Ribonuclease H n=1 Tax=Trifolium pratense TaxID=57577 RepID=A0A2K3LJX4_TRIPR|nr:ribonuclease H [Trifolium pratense]
MAIGGWYNSINFWIDKWTPSGCPLMINATNSIIDTTLLVKDVLTTEGQCDLNFLYTHLNPNIVSQIMAIPAPNGTYGDDTIGWKCTNTHHFTIKNAYDLQHGNDHHINGDWNKIWAWKGPHQIQTFMWIAAHGRLLTNARRSKWGGVDFHEPKQQRHWELRGELTIYFNGGVLAPLELEKQSYF